MDHLEIDLGKEIIDELQMVTGSCRSYLCGTTADIMEHLARDWSVVINYAKRSVNIIASVLALIQMEQSDILVIHLEPPSSLQTALQLDQDNTVLRNDFSIRRLYSLTIFSFMVYLEGFEY